MFQTMNNAAAAYGKVGVELKVESAPPYELILMLYDGAAVALQAALVQLQNGDKVAMSESIVKASAIIGQGLRDSLDKKSGGELAERLSALYDYMGVRLQYANFKGDAAAISETLGLLNELRSAWKEIGKDPAVSATKG